MHSSNSESSGIIDNKQHNKRKGIIIHTKFKSEVIKKAKVKDEAHINQVRKKVMARKTGINCSCRQKYSAKYSELDEMNLLSALHQFDDKNWNYSYLQNMVEVAPTKCLIERSA